MLHPYDEASRQRKPDNEINPLFVKRWSPRSMTGEEISVEILHSLFEAARWAPSSGNEQEWRFLYASRSSSYWEKFFNLLVDGNKPWCKFASHLVVILSNTRFARNGSHNATHSFASGAAFQNLLLEAAGRNLVAHGMSGFDFDRARTELNVPENFAVNAMIAVGVYDPTLKNLDDKYKSREIPSGRKSIKEISAEGLFSFPNPVTS